MKFVLSIILCLLAWSASAQSITVTPASPLPTCGASAGTTVATLSASGLPSGVLTSSWILSGDTTHYQISSNLLASASLVVGPAGFCNAGGVTITIEAPSGGATLATAMFGANCDIGPGYVGLLPAAAVAAGFTHCAANYDFSSTANFTYNGNTYNFSNKDTWFGGGGGCTQQNWLLYNLGYISPVTPCSDFSIVSDSGLNTLRIQYTQADINAGSEMSWMTTSTGGTVGTFFPVGEYIEWVWRLDSGTWYPNNPIGKSIEPWVIFSWSFNNTGNHVEWDAQEWFNGCGNTSCVGSSTSTHDWANGGAGFTTFICNVATGCADGANYHTYGMRATSDGTNYGQCAYTDNALNACNSAAFGNPGDATITNYWGWGIGQQNASGGTLSAPMIGYVRRVTIFACPNWQTQQCNGTVNP